MARPRLGKEIAVRLHIVAPAELIQKIEDWRFANRVGSNSEAIRKLVETGLFWSGIEFVTTRQNVTSQLDSSNFVPIDNKPQS